MATDCGQTSVKGWSVPGGASGRSRLVRQGLRTEGAVPCCLQELRLPECDSSRTDCGSQGVGGHSPQSCAPLEIGGGREGTGQRRLSDHWVPPSCADQHPCPGSIQASVDWELQVVTLGADSIAGELAAASAVVPLVSPCAWEG